ncbi:MAG: hypothetical protein VX938_10990, partial [Myxococcota bacterium]|nr:hypothetical protein [Myxococcota bacterium]
TNEFIELYNGTEGPIALAPYSVRHINGSSGEKLSEWFLADAGAELLPGQFLIIGSANVMLSVPEGALTLTMEGTSDLLQNGPDGVTLLNYEEGSIQDSMAWEGPVEGAGEPLGEGHTYDDNPTESLSRCPLFVD